MKPSKKVVSRIVFLSTYPPRRCGLATFAHDMLQNIQLLLPDTRFEVYALNKSKLDTHAYPSEVVSTIDQDDPDYYSQAAAKINRNADETILIVQHEYGIYGSQYGKLLVPFLKSINCPIITTMHTALEKPPVGMQKITGDIIRHSDVVIALTRNSYDLMLSRYPKMKAKLKLIEHGIHPSLLKQPDKLKPQLKLSSRRVLMTFGLLSRNKGIEYVIKALPAITKKIPNVLYLVIGGTHPDTLRYEGEAYRQELRRLIDQLGMQNHVRFVGDYLPLNEIIMYLQATDIYIAPSLDPQQAVSGTLSYALGAGCAVVSTGFSQAKEVLRGDIGKIVPIGDAGAVSKTVTGLLNDPIALETMRHSAYASTRSMLWPNIADNYIKIAADIAVKFNQRLPRWPEINMAHLTQMTDSYGFFQFASRTKPNRSSGFTLDDNSRALQAVSALADIRPDYKEECDRLSAAYIKTISSCLSYNPVVNYLSAVTKKATSQNQKENLEDSRGRAYYALQITSSGPLKTSEKAKKLIKKLPNVADKASPRTIAFYLLGACTAPKQDNPEARKLIKKLAARLVNIYRHTATADWQWFEPVMTYANGQLCAALLEAASYTNSKIYKKVGLESLAFLRKACFMGEVYVPIGQDGWFARGHERAVFDQQPEDVLAFMQASESAYRLTGRSTYIDDLQKAFTWFLGNNLMGLRMYDDNSGGCHDGLKPYGINPDEGAESTLAYLQARLIVERVAQA